MGNRSHRDVLMLDVNVATQLSFDLSAHLDPGSTTPILRFTSFE